MEISAQFKRKLNGVLKNKIKHSKYIGGGEEDKHFEEINFKFSRVKNRKESYLKEFKPALYYEWSKIQGEEYDLFLSAIFIRNALIFKKANLDVFELNIKDFIKRLNTIDKIFKEFYFEDMKVYFVIEHALNVGMWRKTKLKKFLFDQKEADLNSEIETYKNLSGRAFNLFDNDNENIIESLKSQIREQHRKIRELRAEMGIMHEGYFLLKRDYEELKKTTRWRDH